MKKTLAILALALFIGGISAPVIAASNSALTLISLQEDDPKKKSKGEKAENKGEKTKKTKKTTKSGDCSSEKRSDCSSKCGGES